MDLPISSHEENGKHFSPQMVKIRVPESTKDITFSVVGKGDEEFPFTGVQHVWDVQLQRLVN